MPSILPTLHGLNVALHVGCGIVAIALGFVILSRRKGTAEHSRLGRWFVAFTWLVGLFATVGLIAFRFMPMFAVLTVLVLYQLLSGWHVVYTRSSGPDRYDAILSAAAIAAGTLIAPTLLGALDGNRSVLFSTGGALVALLTYDMARWIFPKAWHAAAWPYEHVYKMLGSLFGMLSALVGNVVRVGQPWSQLMPSLVGVVVVVYFFSRLSAGGMRRRRQSIEGGGLVR